MSNWRLNEQRGVCKFTRLPGEPERQYITIETMFIYTETLRGVLFTLRDVLCLDRPKVLTVVSGPVLLVVFDFD